MQKAEERAANAGLKYADPERLPLRRKRSGSGFTYLDQHSRTVSDAKVKQRLASLAIPPAWKDVRIARDPRSHIQAVGRDAAGRLQYRYHELWTEGGHEVKLERLTELGAGLGKLRAEIEAQLRRQTVDADFTLACAVALLDRAGLRIGYPEYARDDGGRGAATLRRSDVTVRDGKVRLRFMGKGGKDIQRIVDDPQLARALALLKEQPGEMLFRWKDKDGDDACLNADKVNAWLRERIGEETSARDFRTFRASAIAAGGLQELGDAPAAERKRVMMAGIRAASAFLANTPAVARRSYVHPAVQTAFETEGFDAKPLFAGSVREGLGRDETALVRLLTREAEGAENRK